MSKFDSDNKSSISYTAQGELKRNSTESDSIISCHGKYVSLFESDSPWHEMKMKNIHLYEIPKVNEEFNKDINIQEKKEEFNKEDYTKKLINFNTIVSSLFLLIIFLFIIRYYIKH